MFNETIEVSVTYGETIKFFLEMVGIAKERELRARNFGLSDSDKEAKEYQNNVDILTELATKMPEGIDEQLSAAGEGADFRRDVIRAFFAEKTPVKERIAFYAVNGYFQRLLPSESFF